MKVVFFQLLIIAVIWLAWRIHPRFGLWAALAWTLHTLVNLFSPLLILVQLGTIWGAYLAISSSAARARRIKDLEEQLQNHPAATRERLLALAADHLETISGPDHQRVLHEAIEDARHSICILSGWISDKALNSKLLGKLEAALKRGVQIFIGYGYEDSEGKHSESPNTQRALKALSELQQKVQHKKYPGRLQVRKFANHEKMLIVDDALAVCGSNNWLSNSRFRNSERSYVVRMPDFVRQERERVTRLICEHTSD